MRQGRCVGGEGGGTFRQRIQFKKKGRKEEGYNKTPSLLGENMEDLWT